MNIKFFTPEKFPIFLIENEYLKERKEYSNPYLFSLFEISKVKCVSLDAENVGEKTSMLNVQKLCI